MRAVVLCLFLCSCDGLNILTIFPMVSHSHYSVGRSLMRELAKRGHNVTFVAPFEEKEPIKNLRTIVLTGFVEDWDAKRRIGNTLDMGSMPAFMMIPFVGWIGIDTVEMTLSHEKIQQLLHGNEKFDVVVMEQFVIDGLQAIANHFGVPSILVSATGQSVFTNGVVGNPDFPSYNDNVGLDFPIHLNFLNRLKNTLMYVLQRVYMHVYYFPKQNEVVHKYLPNAPHIYDMVYNTSLILLNSDTSYSAPLPHVPNMIQIGGFHVQPAKKLPDDLQVLLDNAKGGVIYFSMGSILKSKDWPKATRDGILRAFSNLKETVLWKFEEEMPEIPANVEIRKWYPQQDILAHPNVKLFITHGGLLSTIESIYHAVPVIGIPVVADQKMNMGYLVHRGCGVMIDYRSLAEENLSEALHEVLYNSKYTEAAKYASRVMHDQPLKPVDKAEFWIEYVVRHKGAPHLRSAALELSWYQVVSLDVILFLTVTTVILFAAFYILMRRLLGKKSVPKQKTN